MTVPDTLNSMCMESALLPQLELGNGLLPFRELDNHTNQLQVGCVPFHMAQLSHISCCTPRPLEFCGVVGSKTSSLSQEPGLLF